MPNFSSFNAFGSEPLNMGQGRTPVWLGTVSPVPVGGTFVKTSIQSGILYGAGFPVNLASKIITPFISWEVVSMAAASASETVDTIVIKPLVLGKVTMLPAVGDKIQKVGATFATTGKAAAVASISLISEGDNKGYYSITVLHSATVDSLSAGDAIALSSAASAGSSKSLAVQPNGYLYNDVYMGNLEGDVDAYTLAATGAVVVDHPEGLLVELTPSSAIKSQMKAAVPGVYQVLV